MPQGTGAASKNSLGGIGATNGDSNLVFSFRNICCGNFETQSIEDSDFCSEDGVTKKSDSSHADVKKPVYKKWWVWTMTVVAFDLIIAALLILRKDK